MAATERTVATTEQQEARTERWTAATERGAAAAERTAAGAGRTAVETEAQAAAGRNGAGTTSSCRHAFSPLFFSHRYRFLAVAIFLPLSSSPRATIQSLLPPLQPPGKKQYTNKLSTHLLLISRMNLLLLDLTTKLN
jgi:hypothetical protein